ncbi:TIGR03619 family F420-dependent LLM class oxidoreductase [Pseudonocardia xinjiangensis]|uniref:TIGR03619 family F420-dependent LLM class oxidoreductase n=1 Tax=Pseudonocardia xinjiangensis TaxID=75289 RepID=UPI003D89F0F7
MKLGLVLPQRYGVNLQRDVVNVAKLAEDQGFDSLWVGERPTHAAPGTEGLYGIPGLPWPEAYQGVSEPLTTMAAAAAVTERVRIGSSVLVPALHHPVQLALALATIDQISGGRVVAGIGSGWAHSDFAAVGVPFSERNSLLDETFDVFEAVWGPDPVEYEGPRITIDKALVGPKPVGKLPVIASGHGEKALDKVARRADGWTPAAIPVASTARIWDRIREKAAGYGRDASAMECIVRANIVLRDQPVDGERQPMVGSLDQVVDDIVETARLGADELIIELSQNEPFPGTPWLVDTALEIKERVLSRC